MSQKFKIGKNLSKIAAKIFSEYWTPWKELTACALARRKRRIKIKATEIFLLLTQLLVLQLSNQMHNYGEQCKRQLKRGVFWFHFSCLRGSVAGLFS